MVSDELLKSWARTTAYLRDARAHIPEGVCADQITAFEEFLDHNELELALDMLDEIVEKSGCETPHMMDLMSKAALSMGLADRAKESDDRRQRTRGQD